MATVSQKIPNLLGGVSQQPDSLKLPGQSRQCTNVLPDPTYGLLKRPGLKLVSNLTGATSSGRWFSIFRDANEKYIGQFATDGTLRVWDALTGAAKTVNSITTAARNYIASVAAEDFEMLQVSDYNFVLNRSKVVQTLSTTSPVQAPTAWVGINQVGYGVTYEIILDGTSYSYTTPTTASGSPPSVGLVTSSLISAIGSSTFTLTAVGNGITIKRNNGADFTVDAKGGLSGNAIVAWKGSVNSVADLPISCTNGLVFKVSNLDNASSDDYYVKFTVAGGGSSGAGIWEETVAPGLTLYLDPATMPHVIIRESNGSFTFRPLDQASAPAGSSLYWKERVVGDDTSNPFPTCVGRSITGISFFRNRLVLFAEQNVICSQPGDFFNLFASSAITITPADAIDISCGSLKPVSIKYALITASGLLLFSEFSQFVLYTDSDVFAPNTAAIKLLSSFTTDPNVRPVETGTSIIFTDNNQGYAGVTEMLVQSFENRPQTSDISRTTPNFIPADIRSVIASPSAFMVSFLANTNSNQLNIFKYFNNGSSRVLAAWFNWILPGEGMLQAFDHDKLYLVTKQQNGYCLSTVSVLSDVAGTAVNSSGIAYEYRLDLFDPNPTKTYVSVSDTTKVYYKAGVNDSTLQPLAIVDRTNDKGQVYILTAQTDGTGTYVTIPGDVTAATVTLGYAFTLTVALPRFYVKQGLSDGSIRADVVNIPRVQRITVESTDTGPFTVSIAALGKTTKTLEYPQVVANSYLANTHPLPRIIRNVIPVMAKGTDVDITLASATPFPLSFVSMTWQGMYSNRGISEV
jgi:hypothetical protein